MSPEEAKKALADEMVKRYGNVNRLPGNQTLEQLTDPANWYYIDGDIDSETLKVRDSEYVKNTIEVFGHICREYEYVPPEDLWEVMGEEFRWTVHTDKTDSEVLAVIFDTEGEVLEDFWVSGIKVSREDIRHLLDDCTEKMKVMFKRSHCYRKNWEAADINEVIDEMPEPALDSAYKELRMWHLNGLE